jgi:hypothetical protein
MGQQSSAGVNERTGRPLRRGVFTSVANLIEAIEVC